VKLSQGAIAGARGRISDVGVLLIAALGFFFLYYRERQQKKRLVERQRDSGRGAIAWGICLLENLRRRAPHIEKEKGLFWLEIRLLKLLYP